MSRDPEGCLSCSLNEPCGRHDDTVSVVRCNGLTLLILSDPENISEGDHLEEQCEGCGGAPVWDPSSKRYVCQGHDHGDPEYDAPGCGASYPLEYVPNVYQHRFR